VRDEGGGSQIEDQALLFFCQPNTNFWVATGERQASHPGQVRLLRCEGTISMSNNANNIIQDASTGNESLTNKGTIEGAGNIGNGFMGLMNQNNPSARLW